MKKTICNDIAARELFLYAVATMIHLTHPPVKRFVASWKITSMRTL